MATSLCFSATSSIVSLNAEESLAFGGQSARTANPDIVTATKVNDSHVRGFLFLQVSRLYSQFGFIHLKNGDFALHLSDFVDCVSQRRGKTLVGAPQLIEIRPCVPTTCTTAAAMLIGDFGHRDSYLRSYNMHNSSNDANRRLRSSRFVLTFLQHKQQQQRC